MAEFFRIALRAAKSSARASVSIALLGVLAPLTACQGDQSCTRGFEVDDPRPELARAFNFDVLDPSAVSRLGHRFGRFSEGSPLAAAEFVIHYVDDDRLRTYSSSPAFPTVLPVEVLLQSIVWGGYSADGVEPDGLLSASERQLIAEFVEETRERARRARE